VREATEQFPPYLSESHIWLYTANMKTFEPYVLELEQLIAQFQAQRDDDSVRSRVQEALDGQPFQRLRELVELPTLRAAGAFFTSAELGRQLIEPLLAELEAGRQIVDPACGAGDLLLACAYQMTSAENAQDTLEGWNKQLHGYDIHSEFVRTARARLVLQALTRSPSQNGGLTDSESAFPNLSVRDGLLPVISIDSPYNVVMNPPFTKVEAPIDCNWASGKVSQSAIFLEKYVRTSPVGTKIHAILPEVLRSGTLYKKWRREITRLCSVNSVEVVGIFDKLTDIDVFIARLTIEEQEGAIDNGAWWQFGAERPDAPDAKISDFFTTRVGAVVPHRNDPQTGELHAYIDVHQAPAWGQIVAGVETRRFRGTSFSPPFVVVRRTSRPEDRFRAVGTIVTGDSSVAVENHLLVLSPKSRSIEDCHRVIDNLKREQTNEWLNNRIRCRHLTVAALNDLPWWIE
jgi:hypothetical protein